MTEPDPAILALPPEGAAPLLYAPWREHVNGGGYGAIAPAWTDMTTAPGTVDAALILGWTAVAARVQAAARSLAAERDRLRAENEALRDALARAARAPRRRGAARGAATTARGTATTARGTATTARRQPAPGARATMRDVAARAGVGLKTVSRVVNHEPGVAPPTAARVTAAISELGFRPNEAARFLRTGRVPAAPRDDASRAVITEALLRADAAAVADDDIPGDDIPGDDIPGDDIPGDGIASEGAQAPLPSL